MPKTGRTHVNQSVSFPPALLKEAKDRARKLRLNFSAYVQAILERDLKEREPLVLDEADRARDEPGRKRGIA